MLSFAHTVTVAAMMQDPASHQEEAVAVARRLLTTGETDAAMQVIRFWFHERSLTSHLIRMIHYNPKNWVLIPHLPRRYRHVADKPWGDKLCKRLHANGQWDEYSKYCGS